MRLLIPLFVCAVLSAGPKIAVHGHRGARAMRPENTIPAFEYAIAAGADALELDMAVTKDNVIVISHDPYLKAPVCTGPADNVAIHTLTLEQVRQWDCGARRNPGFARQTPMPGTRMPALDEVLALAPRGRFDFNIETKIFANRPELAPPPEEFARLVVEAVRKRGLEKRVIVQSFDFRTLAAIRRMNPEIRLSALYSGPAKSFVEIAKEAGAGIVSPEYRLVTPEAVNAAHAAGLKVLPWTVNTEQGWKDMLAAGVDGIITDDPAGLIAFLAH